MRQAKPELAADSPEQISITRRNPNTKARSIKILNAAAAFESTPVGTLRAASLISFDCTLCMASAGKFDCVSRSFS